MRSPAKAVAGLLLLSSALACTKPFHFKTERAELVSVDELPSDFKMPSKVWDLIEGAGKEHESKEAGKEEGQEGREGKGSGEKSGSAPLLYSSVKVFFTEKNPNVLKSPSYEISLPRGGGRIDLSNFVSENPGSFFVGFELPEEFQSGTNFKALFISQARKRKIDDRIFGAGCSQILDITSKFLEKMKTEGIQANTTRQRHVTLLAGHYVFSVVSEGRLYVTQATITDSKNKNLLCEAL